MYEGCNPSALRSQRMLAEALTRLMGEYAFDEITVTMICQESDVSRQTFYKVFGAKENIVRFVAREKCLQLERELTLRETIGLEELASETFSFFHDNLALVRQLTDNRLQYLLVEQAQRALEDLLEVYDCGGDAILDKSNRAFIAGGLIAMLVQWVECGDSIHVGQRARRFADLFSVKEFKKHHE